LLVRWFKQGKLPLDRLVTRRYTLEQINEACDALASGQIAEERSQSLLGQFGPNKSTLSGR
jgi:hypothetical protein